MSKPNATRAHFHAGHNDAGYLPESDVPSFATFEDAKAYMIAELLQAAAHRDAALVGIRMIRAELGTTQRQGLFAELQRVGVTPQR